MAFVPHYILILGATIAVDFFAAIKIGESNQKHRSAWLWFAVLFTLSILFFFKYFNFFIDNVNSAFQFLGSQHSLAVLSIVLPIGLSFHTFQSLSYVIEVYKKNQKPEKHFGVYSLYVLFFPQLVAGPIERPQNMLPQYNTARTISYSSFTSGLKLIFWGLFKKVVIADNLALFVNKAYADPVGLSGGVLILATILFSFQVYCDFSGYSDIARGLARTMGYDLMINFRSPYAAGSLSEFWKRWHISLTSWLRDYVFQPLAVQWRSSGLKGIILATLVTFGLSGLWHGASWTFIIWGLLHGLGLAVEFLYLKFLGKSRKKTNNLFLKFLAMLSTFSFVTFTYIFFRAETIADADVVVRQCLHFLLFTEFTNPIILRAFISDLIAFQGEDALHLCLALVGLLIAVEYCESKYNLASRFSCSHWVFRWSVYIVSIPALIYFGQWVGARNFIYFQF